MKKNNVYWTAGITIAALLMFFGCGERSGEKEYNKAMAAWKSGDLVPAQSLMEKSIRKTSGNEKKSLAYNQLGLILWEIGKVEEAATAFNESCVLAESLSGADLNLGIALFHTGRLAEAEEALNNVLGKEPKNQTALAMLGLIAAQKQDWAGASLSIGKAVIANPDNPAGQNALALAELTRDSTTAVKRLKRVISAHPDYAPAAYNLGVIHEQVLRDKNTALSWYKQYLQKAGSGGSHVKAANQSIARLSGKSQPEKTPADPTVSKRFMAEGGKFLAGEKYNSAIGSFQQAINADPSQKEAHYNMGYAYFKLKKYDEAVNAFSDALRLDPSYADAQFNLTYAYCQLRKWNNAEREAKKLLTLDRVRGEQMIKFITDNRKR